MAGWQGGINTLLLLLLLWLFRRLGAQRLGAPSLRAPRQGRRDKGRRVSQCFFFARRSPVNKKYVSELLPIFQDSLGPAPLAWAIAYRACSHVVDCTLSNVLSHSPPFPFLSPPSPSSLLTCAASDAEEFRQLKALYATTSERIIRDQTQKEEHVKAQKDEQAKAQKEEQVKAQKTHARAHGLIAT